MTVYGALSLAGGFWRIDGLAPHVMVRLKRVFPQVPQTAAGFARLADNDTVRADLLWFIDRYPLQVSSADMDAARAGRARLDGNRELAERILLPEWRPSGTYDFREGRAPYVMQAQAAEMTRALGRLLLLDEVGFGKTVSALATINHPDFLPAAVVVQSHLAEQWVEEYIEHFTTLKAHVIAKTTPYSLPDADIYVFKYSNIAGWADIAQRGVFKSVVFDEIQELRRGPEAQKGVAARVFADAARLRMGLTATPIYNYGGEIFNILEYIAPGILGTRDEFAREWCEIKGKHLVVRDPDALGAFLRDASVVLRRDQDDMPPANVLVYDVPYDEEVADASLELARALALKVVSGAFSERGTAARELDALSRLTTGVAKARHVAAFVRVLLESGRSVILAGWHREVYEIWQRELGEFAPVMYTGSETSSRKRKSKNAFIDGGSDLMFMSLRSGAGTDGLQKRCHTVVFGELDWSPTVHKQLIGRVRRPGQEHQVDAIYLRTDSGSDPVMIEALGVKASQSRGIVQPNAGVEIVQSDGDRMRRLAEHYLARASGPEHVERPLEMAC